MEPSLYIHIPFCKRRCIYCNFYSTILDPGTASEYLDVLTEQLKPLKYKFPTIYIGGGTPTALEKAALARFLKNLEPFIRNAGEVTAEANPESLDDDKIKILLDNGVNRLSIGVQSLRDEKLKKLGRLHSAKRAKESVISAAKKGFNNISADLIFGVWGENLDSLKKELEDICELPITHASCYELTYEKDTPLFTALKNKSVAPLEDMEVAAMYEYIIDRLGIAGIKQYEVSNFAKAGYECRHNMNYWDNNEYVGLGASAVSYIDGARSKNVPDVKEYIRAFREGGPLIESSEKLSPVRRAKETAAIKIRTKDGIDFEWFNKKTGFDLQELEKPAIKDLIAQDLIKYKKNGTEPSGIVLKRKGFMFCDTVSSAMV